MTKNDNWDSLEANDDFENAWDGLNESEDFEDLEVDIPEPLEVSDKISETQPEDEGGYEPAEPKQASPVRPVRKITPKRDDDDDEFEPYDEKKGTGVTILIILLSAVIIGALIFLAIKLVGGSGSASPSGDSAASTSEIATTADWQMNKDADVVSLINSYYSSRTLVDTYTLKSILDPRVPVDEAALTNEAAVIEGYQDITCYMTEGLNSGEWVVYVSYAIKFKNIATPAPGLVGHYVLTDESGALRLIPSSVLMSDDPAFAEYKTYVGKVSDCDAMRDLSATVQQNYSKAYKSDSNLYEYLYTLTGTYPADDESGQTDQNTASSDQSTADTTTEAPTTEAPTTQAPTTQAPTTATPTTSNVPAESGEFETVDTMMYIIKDGVNVRKKPTTDSDVVTTVKTGDYIQITGKGSEWYRVCLKDGTTAYIKKDFFSNEKPAGTAN